ncbi:hypothetical protein RAB80_010157 [Fusarium oxysporum f. sp. vasinfectum]|nr:hypothetical protein RAB80_010157 [Fusarium oxysporum f. sp. vasinfectum]
MDSPKDTETPTEKGKRVHHFIWYLTKDTKDTESSPSPARVLTWRIQLDVVALGFLIPRRGVLSPSIDNITTIAAAAQCHPAEPVIRVEPIITVERDATKASRSPKLPNAS